jgi:thiol reductant ABC exporter CydD subunit
VKPVDPRLLRKAKAARVFIVASVVLGITTAVLIVVQATLIADLITRTFIGGATVRDERAELSWLGIVLVVRATVTWVAETVAYRSAAAVRSQLRRDFLTRAADLGPGWLSQQPRGELAVLATRGLDALDGYFARYLPQLVLACAVPIVVGARVVGTDRISGVIIACTLPLVVVFMILIGLGTRAQMDRQWRALSRLGHHFVDVVTGLPTLKVFGRALAQVSTVRRVSEDLRRATVRSLRLAFLSSLVLELIASLSVAVIAVAIGLRLVNGDVSLRTALLVLVLVPEVYLPLRRVGAAYHASVEGVSAAAEALDVLDVVPGSRGCGAAPDPSRAPLRVEGVWVSYRGRAEPALRGVNVDISPGEIVAVVGPSGCGKSTLIAALLGFVPVDSGRIVVGDVDLSGVDPRAWRRQLGWVGQHPHLLTASIADNIRLGRANASDAQLREAAQRAEALEFIDALPDGFDTMLGEHGVGLSVGQRQRVAIARAFLRDAPLLLLDEPTAALDAESEAAIVRSLTSLMVGRSVLLTSHRPALFTHADRLFVLPSVRELVDAVIV